MKGDQSFGDLLLFSASLASATICGALGLLLTARADLAVRHFVLAFLGGLP